MDEKCQDGCYQRFLANWFYGIGKQLLPEQDGSVILSEPRLRHTRPAKIARRANRSQANALAASGKSERCFRASCLDEEGRYGQSSRHVRRGCDGRGGHVRRTWLARTAKSRGPGLPTLRSSLAMMLCITPATGARKPGPRGDRDISRKPSRRECRLIR